MGIDDNRPSLLPSGRVNEPKPTGSFLSFPQLLRASIADDYALAARVIANVVGVIWELHRTQKLKGCPVINIRDAVQTARNVEVISGGVEIHSLRLCQIGDCPHTLAGLQVDHFEGVVSHSGHKQTLALHIHTEVIDSSFYVRQGDVAL